VLFFFISLSTYFCYLFLKYRKCLIDYQMCDCFTSSYFKFILGNLRKLFLTPELFMLVLLFIVCNCNVKIAGICTVLFYLLLFLLEIRGNISSLKIDRNIVIVSLISLVVFVLLFSWFIFDYNFLRGGFLIYERVYVYYCVLILIIYFLPFVLLFSSFISVPIRRLFGKKHVK
jgi:hypothetical protein